MVEIRGASELASYIARNYPGRVVEVGAGFEGEVARRLMSMGCDVVATEKEARSLGPVALVQDDVFAPNVELYRGAVLIYSIRPPLEMQLAMGRIALQVGADILIRPLGDEIAEIRGFSRRLVNMGQARFYIFRMHEI